MKIILLFVLCILSAAPILAQDFDEGAASNVPPVVLWGLGVYGGINRPLGPDDFAYFWSTGYSLSMEADLLLRNDMVLGLTFGYARAPLNSNRFFAAKGLPKDADPLQDLDVGIVHLLLSFKGVESYQVYRWDWGYEFGFGLYNLSNTQLYVQYWGPETGYTVTEASTTSGGAFAGLSVKYLVTDTLQLSVKGRFHYVWVAPIHHQFLNILVGVTIL